MRQDHTLHLTEQEYPKEFMPAMDVRLVGGAIKFKWFYGADKKAYRERLPEMKRRLDAIL